MTLPLPVDGGRGLRFRVLGFPVRVDLTFLIVIGVLGLSGGTTLTRLLVWIAVAAVSILAHELGHAVLARTAAAASPAITLYGFGGVTTYRPARPLSRLRQLAISIAGPLVGIVIGGALLLAVPADMRQQWTLGGYTVNAAIFVNLGWGVLNLLPILPLDGGHVLAEVLPGDPTTRLRRAAAVSVVVAAAVAVLALAYHYLFGAFLAGWFAVDNLRMLRPQESRSPGLPPPGRGSEETDRSLLWLVDQGRLAEAKHLLDTAPDGRRPSTAVHALLLALTSSPRTGRQQLGLLASQQPDDPVVAGAYVRLLVHDHEWARLLQWSSGPRIGLVPSHLLAEAQQAAYDAGEFPASARIGDAAAPAAGEAGPLLAYNAGCAWARSADLDAALASVSRAVDLGWTDGATADADADLAGVRTLPGWPDVRRRMTDRAQT